jgi:hypothetical protein
MSTYISKPFLPLLAGEEGSFFFQQRQLERTATKPTTELDIAAIAKVENLAAVFEQMRRENGSAPGPDGVSYPHIGRRELFELLRPVSKALVEGTYRPGPSRQVKIPKGGNRGFRTLTLRNLIDRVVAKALNEAMVPFWEKIFLDGCHGYRPGRSNLTLLAQLEHGVVKQDRWVLVSDDVRNAFPSVNIDQVLEDHKRHLKDNPILIRLVDAVLRGDDQARQVGLDQGCPYMPLALNVHLHHVFDAQAHTLGANPELLTPWFRYADNLVVACHDVQEGEQALQKTTQMLQAAGLALKGENESRPVNLRRGGQVQLLGFVLFHQGGRLRYKLGPGAWEGLKKGLLRAHESVNPSSTALAVLEGWIDSHGPAFSRRQDSSVTYALHVASDLGFRELFSHGYYGERCIQAWNRWKSLLQQA